MSTDLQGVYLVLDKIKTELLSHPFCNTVTTGDIFEIDLSKQTMFPLSHIVMNTVTHQDQVMVFNISVFAMDVVDISKTETVDIFYGNNNEIDILNTQLAILNQLGQELRRGSLYKDQYELVNDIVCEPFYDRFENQMAGWVATFDVMIPNNIYIC